MIDCIFLIVAMILNFGAGYMLSKKKPDAAFGLLELSYALAMLAYMIIKFMY